MDLLDNTDKIRRSLNFAVDFSDNDFWQHLLYACEGIVQIHLDQRKEFSMTKEELAEALRHLMWASYVVQGYKPNLETTKKWIFGNITPKRIYVGQEEMSYLYSENYFKNGEACICSYGKCESY